MGPSTDGFLFPPEASWTKGSSLRPIWDGWQSIARQLLTTPIPRAKIPLARTTEADEVRAALVELGVKAQPWDRDSYWTIEIADGPIRLVGAGYNILQENYTIECTVPDSRTQPDFRDFEIRSVRVKSFPVFGRVKEVRWVVLDGEDYAYRVADCLSEKGAVTRAIITSGSDVRISMSWTSTPDIDEEGISESSDLRFTGWTLKPVPDIDEEGISEGQMSKWKVVSSLGQQWACYQTITEALLAMPMPTEE